MLPKNSNRKQSKLFYIAGLLKQTMVNITICPRKNIKSQFPNYYSHMTRFSPGMVSVKKIFSKVIELEFSQKLFVRLFFPKIGIQQCKIKVVVPARSNVSIFEWHWIKSLNWIIVFSIGKIVQYMHHWLIEQTKNKFNYFQALLLGRS